MTAAVGSVGATQVRTEVRTALAPLRKRIARLAKSQRVANEAAKGVEAITDPLREEIVSLRLFAQSNHLRVNVLTETSFWLRANKASNKTLDRVRSNLIKALDNSNEWWLGRKNRTIQQWIERAYDDDLVEEVKVAA